MRKQVLVIGLGQFGMALTRALSELEVEVMAIDRREELVRAAAPFATEVLAMDATDEEALGRLAPARRDLCICAIGDESRESSIICTALLRQLGARRLVARASDELHERILGLVGAQEVVNPERAFGQRLAVRIAHEGVLEELPLGKGLVLTELEAPLALLGRSLADLGLPDRYGVMVVAIRRHGAEGVELPRAGATLRKHDVVVVVSPPGSVGEMLEKVT